MKKKAPKIPQLSESEIQAEIVKVLKGLGIFFWRNNTGGRGKLRFGLKGSSDLIGITNQRCKVGKGRFLAIEVKNKSKKSKASPEQILFLEMINKSGGVGILARSVEDVVKILL
jgi:hypothetical protein